MMRRSDLHLRMPILANMWGNFKSPKYGTSAYFYSNNTASAFISAQKALDRTLALTPLPSLAQTARSALDHARARSQTAAGTESSSSSNSSSSAAQAPQETMLGSIGKSIPFGQIKRVLHLMVNPHADAERQRNEQLYPKSGDAGRSGFASKHAHEYFRYASGGGPSNSAHYDSNFDNYNNVQNSKNNAVHKFSFFGAGNGGGGGGPSGGGFPGMGGGGDGGGGAGSMFDKMLEWCSESHARDIARRDGIDLRDIKFEFAANGDVSVKVDAPNATPQQIEALGIKVQEECPVARFRKSMQGGSGGGNNNQQQMSMPFGNMPGTNMMGAQDFFIPRSGSGGGSSGGFTFGNFGGGNMSGDNGGQQQQQQSPLPPPSSSGGSNKDGGKMKWSLLPPGGSSTR